MIIKINMHLWRIVHIVINVTALGKSVSAFGKTVVDNILNKKKDHTIIELFLF